MSTKWYIVCRWPQSQEGDWARPHLCRLAQHGPWPVWKRLSRDHVWRRRSKPGCQIVGSVTIEWLTTEADDQSSLYCVVVLIGAMSDHIPPSPLLDNIWVMVIIWRLRGNIIRTALCWIVWHNVHSLQQTYMSSSYRSNRLGLSHWDRYAVRRGSCLELYYCNMVEWFWCDSCLISTTNWFPSVLWHCWFGHLACKNRPQKDLLCVE